MSKARMQVACVIAGALVVSVAQAQVPDMVTAFDAGGRAMGAGASFYLTGVDTLSAVHNPAGLGYVDRTAIQLTVRNLPTSTTVVTGPLNDLSLDTSEEKGDMSIGHIGIAYPLVSRGGGNRGVVSLAWTVTGWMEDQQLGAGLPGGISTYQDFTRMKTNLVTLSYGKTTGNQSFSWGFGIVHAIQNVRNLQIITFVDPNVPDQIADSDQTGSGFGATVGFLFTPPNQPNFSLGVSAQSPIKVRDGGDDLALYDTIPGRVAAGAAWFRDGLRSGRDSVLVGGQVEHYFGGSSGGRLDRKDQTVVGVGLEYGYSWGEATIPIRVGYRFVPKGGDGFDSRSGATYGIGYRPKDQNWGFELNFGSPETGANDTALSIIFRLKK